MNDSEKLISCLTSLYGMDIREAVPTLVECISEVAEVDWAVSWDIDPYNSYYRFGNTVVSYDILRSIIIHTDVTSLEGLVTQIVLNCPSDEPRFEDYIPARTLSWEPEPTPRWNWAPIADAEAEVRHEAIRTAFATEPKDHDGRFTADAFRRFLDRMSGASKNNRDDGRLKEGDNKMIDSFLGEFMQKG